MENFVFASRSSPELSLIDWQLMARLRPGYDIAYFLGTSIPEAMRREHQAALRARYLAGLKAGGVQGYSEARFDTDFRLGTMAMTVIPILGGASFDTSNERSVALFGAILARSIVRRAGQPVPGPAAELTPAGAGVTPLRLAATPQDGKQGRHPQARGSRQDFA